MAGKELVQNPVLSHLGLIEALALRLLKSRRGPNTSSTPQRVRSFRNTGAVKNAQYTLTQKYPEGVLCTLTKMLA